MSQSVTVHYTPTHKDYAHVLRLFIFHFTGTKISIVFLAVAFGLIVYSLATKAVAPSVFEIIWVLLPPLIAAFMFIIQPSRYATQAMANKHLAAETTWDVSNSGLEICTQYDSTRLEWNSLEKLVTYKDYYLVLMKANRNIPLFLPRRAFTNGEQQKLFLQILATNLPK
jgi:hypothetical protein